MRVIPQGGDPKKGGPRQVPRSPPLKQTTAQTPSLAYALDDLCLQASRNKTTLKKPLYQVMKTRGQVNIAVNNWVTGKSPGLKSAH